MYLMRNTKLLKYRQWTKLLVHRLHRLRETSVEWLGARSPAILMWQPAASKYRLDARRLECQVKSPLHIEGIFTPSMLSTYVTASDRFASVPTIQSERFFGWRDVSFWHGSPDNVVEQSMCSERVLPTYRNGRNEVHIGDWKLKKATSCSPDDIFHSMISISRTHHFVPVVFESLGPICRAGLDLFRKVQSRITTETHDSSGRMLLFQQLSIALQRGNAAILYI